VSPGLIASQLGNVVPLVVGSPDEVHSVHLSASAESSAAGIIDSLTLLDALLALCTKT
jgi:hypothetical protein